MVNTTSIAGSQCVQSTAASTVTGNASLPNATSAINSNLTQPKVNSKDAHVISTILKDIGISEFEPAVVYQLLEFTYRYVTTVLEDAQIFSHYAKKKNIDAEDIRLAIQLQVDKMFTSPPPRDLLLDIARHKNSQSLPPIRSHCGPRLPPDRYSLIVCNYKLKSGAKIKSQQSQPAAHVPLQFRSGTSLLSGFNRQQPLIIRPTASAVAVGNRISVAIPEKPANELNSEEVSTGVKRKLEES
ncbi:transcription initiation factor TFII-D component-like protein [Leptotrombidium deliense]|uniref:Transcription initiation factor TFII-D component-like protein n=1 Tax=Leptotrombidium deliense TaxID=299467 RepID=A0A443SKU7_9ACAR|nr:transcription initiation factor TFII-D component-like protein [Leptotrombidium deliense]